MLADIWYGYDTDASTIFNCLGFVGD